MSLYRKIIFKTGNTLEIHPKKGETLRFVEDANAETYDGYRTYHAIAVLKPIQLAVIIVGRWEGREVLLVSLEDGTSYNIDGIPVVSPDEKRMAVYSMDIDANYNQNFIAIYHLAGGRLEMEFTLTDDNPETEQWGPDDVKWVSSSKIEFQRVTHSSDPSGYTRAPWELIKKGTEWAARPRSIK